LRFVYHRPVLDGRRLWRLTGASNIDESLAVLKDFHEKGYRIRFLTSRDEGLAMYPFPFEAMAEDWASEPFIYSEIVHDPLVPPFTMRDVERRFRLYTWTPGDEPSMAEKLTADGLDLDVGGWRDAPYLVSGFYGREATTGERSVRWTEPEAVIEFFLPTDNDNIPAMDLILDTVDMHRPDAVGPGRVALELNGYPMVTDTDITVVGRRLRTVADGSQLLPGRNEVIIYSDPWVPAEVLGLDDHRALGVMIDRMWVRPSSP
jgi:hypothetical protein